MKKRKEEKQLDIIILHLHAKNLDLIYSSWDIECDELKLIILGHFLPFQSPKNPNKSKPWKYENYWRYHHITHVCQKIIIIWCMVPEVQTESNNIIFGHFEPFFALLTL